MAVRLRLMRFGSKKSPFYRIVAADSRAPRDGKFIEVLGTYNPTSKSEQVKLKNQLILKWLNVGAQPTDTVKNILSSAGIMEEFVCKQDKRKDS